MKKLFLLLLLSLGLTTISYADNLDDWTKEQLCKWKYLPPADVVAEIKKRNLRCGEHLDELIYNLSAITHEFDTSVTLQWDYPQPDNYESIYGNVIDPYGRPFSSFKIPDRWTNLKTPLMDIEIPEDWSLIDDYDRYQEIISRNANIRGVGYPQNPSKSDCIYMLHNFEEYAGRSNQYLYEGLLFADCLIDLRARLYEGDKEYILDMFEHWAREDAIKQPKRQRADSDFFLTLNYISGIYAQEKDNIEFSDTVKSWLTDRLLNAQLRNFETNNNTVLPRARQLDFFTWANDCSTTRFKYTEAQLVGGLALGNKEIFDEGIDSLQYITTIFDDKNIYTCWAARGIRAMGYHNQIPAWLTNYAVILDSVGYDFMEHEMPNGSKVHEAIKFSFDHVWEDDLSIFWPYIQINLGTAGNDSFAQQLKPMHKRVWGLPVKPQRVVRQSIRYVEEYQPELKDRFGYEEVYSKNVTGTRDFALVYKVDTSNYGMYILASAFDTHSIYKASEKVLLAEQEACKVSELDGEYIAKWYRVSGEGTENVNDNKEPDFQGSERLILDGCVGEFEGVESFQPSKELRKRLHVTYKPNGQITISGYLDPWEVEYSYFTVLKGDLNSGEILDFWGNGSDLIKIEIIKTEPEPEINWDEDKLKGEYVSKWHIGNTFNKPVTFEYRGKDTLTLEKGKGVFSGAFSGMGYRFPSRDERGKLEIDYKPNGEITVEGDLGIFHDNKSYPTFLEGDINSGLISGVWAEGDLIKIEITKTGN